MPIKDKDFGKYKRPGIFIEEIDSSVITLPVQDVLINLVPGFSKKGPVNAPIYITNPTEFVNIFGEDDKRLENKGSFFHKTCKQMLKSGPIWALNLLATNPNRDKVDWQSISVSALHKNDDTAKRAPYESFFNKQSFWERDTDAFLNVVKSNNFGMSDDDRLFHITNMSDKDITVFMFKSDITGFDVTAEEWYGNKTKVPEYIDYREWISDYLVTVLVVAGDWTNYKTLSNDPTYINYFNKKGLNKNRVNDFVNERTVQVLAKYDCSLIPYFKDLNQNDMYIKNVINNNTDRTGLFCTYNEDSLLETDVKLGNVDIIGDTISGDNLPSINFMSYDTNLKEQISYTQKYLDSSNNVITNNLDSYNQDYLNTGVNDRTGVFTNGHIHEIYFNSASTITGLTNCTVQIADNGLDAYYVINGIVFSGFTTTDVTLDSVTFEEGSRIDVLYLSNDNNVNVLYGDPINNIHGAIKPDYNYSLDSTIILGYVNHVKSGSTYTLDYIPVSINDTTYIPIGDASGYNTIITDGVDTIGSFINIEFDGTMGKVGVYNDYDYLRQSLAFNEIQDKISNESVLIKYNTTFNTGDKVPITNTVIINATSANNANIKLYVEDAENCHNNNKFLLYFIDDEFLLHDNIISTNKLITRYDVLGTSTEVGIVSRYSKFYKDYYNGIINNLDYFYVNNDESTIEKIFLKMYIDQNDILNVSFLTSVNPDTLYLVNHNDWSDENLYNLKLNIHSKISNWKQTVEIEEFYSDDLTTCQSIKIDKNRFSEVTRGGFLAAYYDEDYYSAPNGEGYLNNAVPRKLTRIIRVQNDPTDVNGKILFTDAPIKIEQYNGNLSTTTFPTIDRYVNEYKGIKLSPFIVHKDSIPNGTDERQNEILNVIAKDTNLALGLSDKNKISWRYLIDSFGLGLIPIDGFGSKQQLADICGKKLNCLGFINMPSAKIFRESVNPSFVDDDGTLNLEYIKNGADDTKNPDFYYQFAQRHGEIDGRSCVGYFFPYVRIFDNGIPKWMPPSSYAATTYMQKFVSNVAGFTPWTIAAGITNGRIQGITKTEMDFTEKDQEFLYQMNANPILYKTNNGYCINSESTAQVFPYSSLSFLHSREVLIELENRLYDMLLRYQWQFNTPEIRAEIKYRADKICKDILDNDGFYDFWNVCDGTNNTDHVIDLQMGVLDTYVEIIKGMGIIVNNITIMKKGDIQSMGFR